MEGYSLVVFRSRFKQSCHVVCPLFLENAKNATSKRNIEFASFQQPMKVDVCVVLSRSRIAYRTRRRTIIPFMGGFKAFRIQLQFSDGRPIRCCFTFCRNRVKARLHAFVRFHHCNVSLSDKLRRTHVDSDNNTRRKEKYT